MPRKTPSPAPRNPLAATISSFHRSGSTYRRIDKAAASFSRWATTDHYGAGDRLARMPKLPLMATIRYVFALLLGTLISAAVTGISAYLLIAYGIPLLLSGHR